jgi:Rieske 2Fe-2S family protein
VYEPDGSLRGGAWLNEMRASTPADLGLLAVRHEVWGGWVFVNLSADAPPLADVLGSLVSLDDTYGLADLVLAHREVYDVAGNWKLVIEGYHECWHCPLIHPELSRWTPANSGEHVLEQVGAWVGGTMQVAPGASSMTTSGRAIGPPIGKLAGTSLQRKVGYLGVFPNFMLGLHPDYVLTHRIDPVSATQCRVVCDWLVPAAETDGGILRDVREAVEIWDLTNRQDWAAVESVQRGIMNPLFRRGPLGIVEDDVYGFIQMVARGYLGERPEGIRQPAKVR